MTLDIEIYDRSVEDTRPQGRYLVHGSDDVLWADDLNSALGYLGEECERLMPDP